MSTQVQVRGAATATQEARTLASRVEDIDTTLGRLNIHNGTDAGGIPHMRFIDALNQLFSHGSVSGTNALTLTLLKTPAAYATGMKISFFAANACTSSVTINVNSLGAKTIKKITSSGLVDLVANDILATGYYEAVYDGTYFVLQSGGGGGSGNSGKQLFTSSGTFTVPAGITTVYISGSGAGAGGGGDSGNGGAGGTSVFGSLVTLSGGGAGGRSTADGTGGAGGAYTGTDGQKAYTEGGSSLYLSGGNGGGVLDGKGGYGNASGTAAATNSGDGGGGCGYQLSSGCASAAGGGGAGQKQYPTAYTVTAGSSHTVTLNNGGSAGTGGGITGGAGAKGWLLVEW